MIQDLADRADVSQPVMVLLLILAAVQVVLAIFALVDLVRRDRVAWGHKWIWVLLILFGNIAGSVLYLAVGRNPEPDTIEDLPDQSGSPESRAERIRRGIDALYGPDEVAT